MPTRGSIPVVQPQESDVTQFFAQQVMSGGAITARSVEARSDSEVVTEVAARPGAIGYVTLGAGNRGVRALRLASLRGLPYRDADLERVYRGEYPLTRFFNLYVRAESRPVANGFITYITSIDGQKLVQQSDSCRPPCRSASFDAPRCTGHPLTGDPIPIMNDRRSRRFALALALSIAAVFPVAGRTPTTSRTAAPSCRPATSTMRMQSFEKAASQGQAEGRAGVGQVWLKRHQYDKALEAFRTAQKMDPTLALGYWGEGEVLRQRDKCAEAIPLFRKATELDRKFPEAQLALGDCLVATGNHAKAVEALSEGLKWGPKWRPRFLVALGDAEMARDSLRDAGIYFTRAREEAPDDPDAAARARRLLPQARHLRAGDPEHQAAIALDSTDVDLHYALGQALYYDQRYNDALEQYRWVTTRDPDYPRRPAGARQPALPGGRGGPAPLRRGAHRRSRTTRSCAPDDPKGWSLLGRTYFGAQAARTRR